MSDRGVVRNGKRLGPGRPPGPVDYSEDFDLEKRKQDLHAAYRQAKTETLLVANVLKRISTAERKGQTSGGRTKDHITLTAVSKKDPKKCRKESHFNVTLLMKLALYWRGRCDYLEKKLKEIAAEERDQTSSDAEESRELGIFDGEPGVDPGGNGVQLDRDEPPDP